MALKDAHIFWPLRAERGIDGQRPLKSEGIARFRAYKGWQANSSPSGTKAVCRARASCRALLVIIGGQNVPLRPLHLFDARGDNATR